MPVRGDQWPMPAYADQGYEYSRFSEDRLSANLLNQRTQAPGPKELVMLVIFTQCAWQHALLCMDGPLHDHQRCNFKIPSHVPVPFLCWTERPDGIRRIAYPVEQELPVRWDGGWRQGSGCPDVRKGARA